MGDDSRRRRPAFAGECGVDRISCLPDELLHVILLCLDSSRAAGRTSVLSHRWRRVWAHLPALVLFDDELPPPSSSFPDTVDAALATYAAPILQHLSIWVPDHGPGPGPGVPAHRVSPWLHFTSQRVTGSFSLNFRPNVTSFVAPEVAGEEAEELELPACSAATWITLNLEGSWRLRTAGVFLALTRLEIQLARMEGGVLSDLVSTQCPRLKKLSLLVTLVAASDVSIHSDSLQSLSIFVRDTRRLEVIATGLEELHLWTHRVKEVHISAPKLAKVAWCGAYDPCQHQFILAPRSLRLLTIEVQATSTSLMRQFDEVDELSLQISIPQGLAGYQSFLNEINKIPKYVATVGILAHQLALVTWQRVTRLTTMLSVHLKW
ncbi:hypothetical protein QOZ80_9BG0710270 [Eleusine coracana subsp. coracana]|nr:hypothetical protein QOZ80_9BG0710270 [Eleusine coracana subsp. coracana]